MDDICIGSFCKIVKSFILTIWQTLKFKFIKKEIWFDGKPESKYYDKSFFAVGNYCFEIYFLFD